MIAERREGPVAILTLDREDKANALTRDMLLTLSEAVTRLSAEPDVRVLILTGAGRVFSAGADLDAARAGLATDPVWEDLSASVANAPILTIAFPISFGLMAVEFSRFVFGSDLMHSGEAGIHE